MGYNPKSWLKNSIKYGAKLKNKSLRLLVKTKLRKGEFDGLQKKLPIEKDDGS